METMLGFEDDGGNEVVEGKPIRMKLVPWISWDEWMFVKESLFSSNPYSVTSAIHRIRTWQSRGCIPVLVEVTASIVEIRHKDPFFRNDLDDTGFSTEELAMLYCMAVMRLVNGVIEKNRKKNEISIGEAAEIIGIPRMLIDIRHEGSHRGLPSLQLLRVASEKALGWLVRYYWEPQEKLIAPSSNTADNLKREIKCILLEVAFSLKQKQEARAGSSNVRGKGIKDQLAKSIKSILQLYSSSFSQEVIHILLDYVLNALNNHLREISENLQIAERPEVKQTAFDDWKSFVVELSSSSPEFLVALTQGVLEKLETNKAFGHQTDDKGMMGIPKLPVRIKLLWRLLEWLTGSMKKQTESPKIKAPMVEKHLSKEVVRGLLRRCLLASPPPNKVSKSAVITLAELNGHIGLLQNVRKLVSMTWPLVPETESSDSLDLGLAESSLSQALEKFHSVTRHQIQTLSEEPVKSRWAVTKSWNPCPIGMLPHHVGFSGRLPNLDNQSDETCFPGMKESSQGRPGKREADSEKCDKVFAKRMKETEADYSGNCSETVGGDCPVGRMLIGGAWKSIGEQELLGIASTIRLLVEPTDI